jgi:cell division septation protein DedD
VRTDRSADSADALATAAASPAPSQIPPSVSTARPPTEAPPPAQDTDDNLSYAKRLQSTKAPKEQLNAPPPAARTQTAAVPAASSRPSAPVARSNQGTDTGRWVVQVQALKDRSAAQSIAQRLIAKGYPAFVLDPDPGAPTIYRVQMGRYTDRREAEQVARKLEKDEQYKPIIHSAR